MWTVVAAGCAACAATDLQFHTTTPDGPPRELTVSVLGVYHDGRLAADEWASVGAPAVGGLGGDTCGILFSTELDRSKPELAAAIDRRARADGVTEALFEALAPATTSEAIVLVEVSGRAPKVLRTEVTPRAQGLTRTKSALPYNVHTVTDGNAFDVAVSAYSVREHRIVAALTMHYTGKRTDVALREFADRFAKTFAGWRCAAWPHDLPLEPTAIDRVGS